MSKIIKLITAIRNSNENVVYLYSNGECYNFALILKSMFDGEIWYSGIKGHVWFKYQGEFYDIEGKCLKPPRDIHLLDHDSGHRPHRWCKMARKEHMLIRVHNDKHFVIKNNEFNNKNIIKVSDG